MIKKMKLRYRVALMLAVSTVLSGISAAAFSINGSSAVEARAEEIKEGTNSTEKNAVQEETGNKTSSENAVVSGNNAEEKCTCEKKCSPYDYDRDCAVCSPDYAACEYKTPNIVIKINKPDGWYSDSAKVTFSISDIAHTGNFKIGSIQAKVGQNGGWTDVTEDRELEISENCTVYVLVTDQRGDTYERSRMVRCFDRIKPTLNAAVSGGLLSVQVHDTDSGAKTVYVNGYEFTELTNGTLNIRLQQFDSGYEHFTISAMDNAGNMSEIYQVKNPYYKDPADKSSENPAAQLPESAEATKPGNAAGTVTEHIRTDDNGNAVAIAQMTEESGEQPETEDKEKEESGGRSEKGKEFYTIQTASEKVFYLVIDRGGEEEKVYFLTEIMENDLLNAISGNTETLPQNSAALESAVPANVGAASEHSSDIKDEAGQEEDSTGENIEEMESMEETGPGEEAVGQKTEVFYILIGMTAAAFIGGIFYFKTIYRKKEEFFEDEDTEEPEEYEYENEDEEPQDSFFDRDEPE